MPANYREKSHGFVTFTIVGTFHRVWHHVHAVACLFDPCYSIGI